MPESAATATVAMSRRSGCLSEVTAWQSLYSAEARRSKIREKTDGEASGYISEADAPL